MMRPIVRHHQREGREGGEGGRERGRERERGEGEGERERDEKNGAMQGMRYQIGRASCRERV